MHFRFRFRLWFLPILGILIGIASAFIFIHGLIVTWHFLGKPPDNISEIIGVVGINKLYVLTDAGDIYSIYYFRYINEEDSSFPPPFQSSFPPVVWSKEENHIINADPNRKPLMKFYSLPLLFKVKQTYEWTTQLVEGEKLTKFALTEDGNIWAWNYGTGSLAGITYYIFPTIGLIVGIAIMIIMKVGIYLWGKVKGQTSQNREK